MPTFVHDGITFHYQERGAGRPFVFQHGLGGDANQPFDLLTPQPVVRLISLDCRAHGATQPSGAESRLGFATFADDVTALLDHLDLDRVVMGGISMGAGVALNLALRFPQRVQALILLRPAWLDCCMPDNLLIYPALACALRALGATVGRRRFAESGAYLRILAESPDTAASLLGQFDQPQAAARGPWLERLPWDRPCADVAACADMAMPVLVLANRHDPIHPYALAQELANQFPAAHLVEITAKSVSRERHRQDVQTALNAFLGELLAGA